MIACQLLYFRQHGHFPDERSDFDPDVIDCVADQIGAEDDPALSFSSDTTRRQRAGILDFQGFAGHRSEIGPSFRHGWMNSSEAVILIWRIGLSEVMAKLLAWVFSFLLTRS